MHRLSIFPSSLQTLKPSLNFRPTDSQVILQRIYLDQSHEWVVDLISGSGQLESGRFGLLRSKNRSERKYQRASRFQE